MSIPGSTLVLSRPIKQHKFWSSKPHTWHTTGHLRHKSLTQSTILVRQQTELTDSQQPTENTQKYKKLTQYIGWQPAKSMHKKRDYKSIYLLTYLLKPKPTGPSSPVQNTHTSVQKAVHNCGKQHSTEQLLLILQSSLLRWWGEQHKH